LRVPAARRPPWSVPLGHRLPPLRDPLLRREQEGLTMLAPDRLPALRPFLSARKAFASGADTPRDYLERCLASLDAWEPRVGAFVTLNIERARAAAEASTRRWYEGKPLSPIDGMPLGIKDIIETSAMRTTTGSPSSAGWRPTP